MVVRDGRSFGGNAGFALAGQYRESGLDIEIEITTLLRNDNPGFSPVAGADTITLRGSATVTSTVSTAAAVLRCLAQAET